MRLLLRRTLVQPVFQLCFKRVLKSFKFSLLSNKKRAYHFPGFGNSPTFYLLFQKLNGITLRTSVRRNNSCHEISIARYKTVYFPFDYSMPIV
jgi:hypothetical protein